MFTLAYHYPVTFIGAQFLQTARHYRHRMYKKQDKNQD
jgi:hypothetical protein